MKEKAYLMLEIPHRIRVRCPKCGHVSIFTREDLIEVPENIPHLTFGCKSRSECKNKVLVVRRDRGVTELIRVSSITVVLKRRGRRRRSKTKVAGK